MCWGGVQRSDLNGEAAQATEDPAEAAAADAATEGSVDAEPAAADENPYATEYYADADKAPGVTSITIPATVEALDLAFFQLFPNASAITVDPANSTFTSYNGMLFGADEAGDPTDLLLVPEGMEGAAVLPSSMATVPACVFSRCLKLSAIVVPTGSTVSVRFASENGILYNADKTTLIAAPAGLGASATIALECTAIASGAFLGNEALRTIISTGNIAEISAGSADVEPRTDMTAFEQSVVDTATVITDDRLAWEAAGFTRFAEPAAPGDTVEASGFAYTLLDDYTLAVSWSGESAPPADLVIPASAAINGIEYTVSAVTADGFADQPLATLVIPDGVATIGDSAFAGCAALQGVQLAGSVISIGASAFEGCTALASIDLGAGLRAIGDRAFASTSLRGIFLPATLDTIGSAVFADCGRLTTVVALGSISDVSATALADASGVSVYVPYQGSDQSAWVAGAPAAANHLLPYGVRPSAEMYDLKLGESQSIFADPGYQLVPGEAQLELAYKAKYISVDETGTVSAKQAGTSSITASITLNGRTLATASCAVEVRKKHATSAQPNTAVGADAAQSAEKPDPNEETVVPPNVLDMTLPLDATNSTQPDQPSRPAITEGTYLVDAEANKGESADTDTTTVEASEEPAEDLREEETAVPEEDIAIAPENPADMPEHQPGAGEKTALENLLNGIASISDTSSSEASEDVALDADDEQSIVAIDEDEGNEADPAQQEGADEPERATAGAAVANAVLSTALTLEDAGVMAAATQDPAVLRRYGRYAAYLNANGGELRAQWADDRNLPAADSNGFLPAKFTWSGTTDNRFYHDGGGSLSKVGGSTSSKPWDSTSPYSNYGYIHTSRIPTSDEMERIERSDAGYYRTDDTYGDSYRLRVLATRTGYNFDAWRVNSATGKTFQEYVKSNNSGTSVSTSSVAYLNGIRLYASWIPIEYKIAFNGNGGTGQPSGTYDVTYHGTLPSITAKASKPGYVFNGYWTAKNGGTQYYDKDLKKVSTYRYALDTGPGSTCTLYAQYTLDTYTLTRDLDDGKAATTTDFNVSSNISFGSIPTREGYAFVGWKITGDMVTSGKGSGIKVSGSSTSASNSAYETYVAGTPLYTNALSGTGYWGDVTITAMWRSTITLKKTTPPVTSGSTWTNTGTFYYYPGYGFNTQQYSGQSIYKNRETMTVYAGTNSDAILGSPLSADGYTFKGFFNADDVCILTEEGKLNGSWGPTGATSLYSGWEAIEYKITLDLNKGNPLTNVESIGLKDNVITYTKGQTNIPCYSSPSDARTTPKRDGWAFVGWRCTKYDDSITNYWATDGTPRLNFYTSSSQYGNYTLEAVWKATLTLDGNAPQAPKATTVTQDFKGPLYYYTGYGFSTSAAPTVWHASAFLTKLFGGGRSKPVCSDPNWTFGGYYATTLPNDPFAVFEADGSVGDTRNFIDTVDKRTLYARWTPKTYKIILDANTGTQTKTTEIEYVYGEDYDAASGTSYPPVPRYKEGTSTSWTYGVPIPTKDGWKFAGYYTGSGDNETLYYRENYQGLLTREAIPAFNFANGVLAGDITLKAKWQRDILLHPNGGFIPGRGAVTATYGEKLPAPLPVRSIPDAPTSALEGVTWTFRQYAGFADDGEKATYYDKDGKLTYEPKITSLSPTDLYAQWGRAVALDNNGGEGVQETVYVIKGDKADDIKTCPKLEGYVFTGFYTERSGGTQTHDENGKWTGNVDTDKDELPATIYAHYEGAPAYIVFDANPPAGYEATGGPEQIEGKTDQKIVDRALPTEVPTVPDYVFSYWSVFPTGVGRVEELPEKFSAGTTTYYANYEEKPYSKVIFNTAGDSYGGGKLSYYDDWIRDVMEWSIKPDTAYFAYDAVAHPDDGYEFVGWYEGDTLLSTSATWRPQRPEAGWPAETTYTARFQQKTYTITYRCAECGHVLEHNYSPCKHVMRMGYELDGQVIPLPRSFKYENIADSEKAITIAGPDLWPATGDPYYAFEGWTGTDVEGQPSSVTISTIGDKTYDMHVSLIDFTLTLDAGQGGWSVVDPGGFTAAAGAHMAERSYNVETEAFELPTPVWPGRTFNGWEMDNGHYPYGTTFIPDTAPGQYGNITLVATWSDNPYQITYELSDELGTGALPAGADNPLNYDYSSDDIALPIPSRVGYDFLGWIEQSISDDGEAAIEGDGPQIDVTIPSGSWGNRTYKAHWRAHAYNVRYDLDGGSWDDAQLNNPVEATYDADVTIAPAPKKPGYLFRGYQMQTADGVQSFTPGQAIARPNWVAEVGEPAYEGVPVNKGGEVVITALWKVNISVDVIVGSEGVHMGLERKADSWDPFTTTRGEAVLKNYTDAPVKVTGVMPNKDCDYGTLKANALQVFRGEQSLGEASFSVRPERGTAANTQRGRFALADPAGGLTLQDDAYLNGNPAHTFAFNWMMSADGAEESKLRLYYELDMGELKPEDVDLSRDVDLQVADLVYTVALVCP